MNVVIEYKEEIIDEILSHLEDAAKQNQFKSIEIARIMLMREGSRIKQKSEKKRK